MATVINETSLGQEQMDTVDSGRFERRAPIGRDRHERSGRSEADVANGMWTTAATFPSRITAQPKALVAAITALTVLILWETAVRTGLTGPTPIPTATRVFQVLGEMAAAGTLWKHTSISLQRVTLGYALAVALAIPVGFLLGWFKTFEKYLDPPLQVLRQVPLLAWFPVFIMLFGVSEVSKTLLITLTAFWWILIGTVSAVKNIEPEIVRTARAFGLSHLAMFRKIVLPAVVPSLFVALRLAYTEVILILIAVEVQGANFGLGTLLANDECHAGPDHVMVYSICIFMTAIGLLVNYILVALEKRLCGWQEEITDI
jgi:NitT/TauT family transport system permease protein